MLPWYKFCSFCGSDDTHQPELWKIVCRSCGKITFINPATAAGCFLFDRQWRIGLAKRAHDPRAGKYDDAGGFCDIGDTSCEDTVIREIHEELGIVLRHEQLQYIWSHAMKYPFQWRDTYTMPIIFRALLDDEQVAKIVPNDDVASFDRFTQDQIHDDLLCTPRQTQFVRDLFALASDASTHSIV